MNIQRFLHLLRALRKLADLGVLSCSDLPLGDNGDNGSSRLPVEDLVEMLPDSDMRGTTSQQE